ncbi:hypothetical protein N0V88_006821 [Collariella sp. IMI 366227]|nr:hypothetical protein N0V88_006821 [Collariella sp. IMI 366227]
MSMPLVLLCSFAGVISAANLYYTYPVLNKAAEEFGVSYERASLIPQLLQAGYGCGILLLCPLGDVFRLRPMILTLLTITTAAWVGLCLTDNFEAFTALSFLTGFVTISPQFLLPLVGTITPPNRQATAVSIVLAGQMMGLAVPRVVTGIITQYTDWRSIYWAALGLQVLLVATMLRKYARLLREIILMVCTKPILAHGCAVTFLTNAALASFWTTLTAHLAAAPRNFGPLQIGLVSLVAVGTTSAIPLYSYLVIERYTTYIAAAAGLVPGIAAIAVDAYAGGKTGNGVGGAVIQAVGVDFGVQVASVAYRAAVYRELPAGKANVTFTFAAFVGQLVGTSVGNAVYARGGWTQVGAFNVALAAAALGIVVVRGPRETGWFGWTGGARRRLKVKGGGTAEV